LFQAFVISKGTKRFWLQGARAGTRTQAKLKRLINLTKIGYLEGRTQREGKAQEMPEENKSQVPKPETEIEGKNQAVQAPSIPPPIKLEASTLRREELAEELARDPMH
jgi:hypothetical protein